MFGPHLINVELFLSYLLFAESHCLGVRFAIEEMAVEGHLLPFVGRKREGLEVEICVAHGYGWEFKQNKFYAKRQHMLPKITLSSCWFSWFCL